VVPGEVCLSDSFSPSFFAAESFSGLSSFFGCEAGSDDPEEELSEFSLAMASALEKSSPSSPTIAIG
jgi:hypothetical protein